MCIRACVCQVLEAIATFPNICRQLHLPAQSGSTTVLVSRYRRYSLRRSPRKRIEACAVQGARVGGVGSTNLCSLRCKPHDVDRGEESAHVMFVAVVGDRACLVDTTSVQIASVHRPVVLRSAVDGYGLGQLQTAVCYVRVGERGLVTNDVWQR